MFAAIPLWMPVTSPNKPLQLAIQTKRPPARNTEP